MTQDEARHDGGRHERSGGHERALRQPRQTAHAMTAGAAAAEARAEADQEPTDHDEGPRVRNRDERQFAPRHSVEQRGGDQPDGERNPPCDIASTSRPKPADDTADPGS